MNITKERAMNSTPVIMVIWCCRSVQSVGAFSAVVFRLVLFLLLSDELFLRLDATDLLKAKDYREAIVKTKIGKIY